MPLSSVVWLEVPAKARARHGPHRPVSQGHKHGGRVEQAQDPDPQPPPRPGTHQRIVSGVDAVNVMQVPLDQQPLTQNLTPGQSALAVFLRVVDPAREARGVTDFTGVAFFVAARRAALFAGTGASPDAFSTCAAISSPIAK